MAPHQGRSGVPVGAPNAALLIDFDNVTMGIRSDLTRQLKELLNSDIIKGKVAVQRAYADWRRYAQYIVPLSEASVDLIFAPAYGSSKKNATDIRLAIDALELVFTRPEIGVFILLSGDSDFSSLVLKLKEYGKYVIGVGLRESASDLLVQNCDEYFSYSSLTGLTRAGEEDVVSTINPWDLTERAVRQMAEENDVMRSDRLKQVMLEMDPSFDEGQLGFTKFNRFLTEASSKSKLALRKLDNGQYEVQPFEDREPEAAREAPRRGRGRREPRRDEARAESRKAAAPDRERGSSRGRGQEREPARDAQRPAPRPATRERKEEDLKQGYDLLQRAVRDLTSGGDAARDSDIKRHILELEPGWDESTIGFTKFSRFLRQAHDAEVVDLQKSAEGFYEARLPRGMTAAPEPPRGRDREDRGARERGRDRDADRARGARGRERLPERDTRPEIAGEAATEPAEREPAQPEMAASEPEATSSATEEEQPAAETPVTEGPPEREEKTPAKPATPKAGVAARSVSRGRRGRRGGADGPPPLLPGQVVGGTAKGGADNGGPAESIPMAEPDAGAGNQPVEAPSSADAVPAEAALAADAVPAARPGPGAGADFDALELGLPTDSGSVIRYLSNSYPGVGQKTAETLINAFGADRVFHGLHAQPERVREMLGSGRRTDSLLEAWQKDFRRRTTAGAAGSAAAPGESAGTA
ncbi:MAG TPA: NYN domain-containing protein [Longimicrobiales bacterium]|nr:NYN domain-containing protein [Longimicrobiales bacterium]